VATPRWIIAIPVACALGCARRPPAPVLGVERYGNGPTTVIVLHGGPGFSHSYLLPEWKRVIDSTRRVVFYDQRGCGKSTRRGPYTWQQHVEDLDRLIRESQPATGGPVILAGTSWGSWLALLYTKRHPERITALVLSGVPVWPDTAALARGYARYSPSTRATIDSINAGLPASTFVADSSMTAKGIVSGSIGQFASRLGPYCVDAHLAIWASLRTVPPLDSLRSIGVPVLIVHGTDTSRVPDGAPALAAVLPHAVMHDIHGAGHDPWYEQPDSTFSAVNAFIDRVSRTRD
jgi:proline iminopeptidase